MESPLYRLEELWEVNQLKPIPYHGKYEQDNGVDHVEEHSLASATFWVLLTVMKIIKDIIKTEWRYG